MIKLILISILFHSAEHNTSFSIDDKKKDFPSNLCNVNTDFQQLIGKEIQVLFDSLDCEPKAIFSVPHKGIFLITCYLFKYSDKENTSIQVFIKESIQKETLQEYRDLDRTEMMKSEIYSIRVRKGHHIEIYF